MKCDEQKVFFVNSDVSVNVYKQTTPEIPEVTCTRRTIMDFCTRRLWYGLSAWEWNYS